MILEIPLKIHLSVEEIPRFAHAPSSLNLKAIDKHFNIEIEHQRYYLMLPEEVYKELKRKEKLDLLFYYPLVDKLRIAVLSVINEWNDVLNEGIKD